VSSSLTVVCQGAVDKLVKSPPFQGGTLMGTAGSTPVRSAWSSSELNAVWESAENQNLSLCPCSLIVESLFCTQRVWMQFPPWALSTFGREGRRGPHKTVQTGAVPVRCIG